MYLLWSSCWNVMCMEVFSHWILTYCLMKIHLNLDLCIFCCLFFFGWISLKYCQRGMDFITALTKHGKDQAFLFLFFFFKCSFWRTEPGMKKKKSSSWMKGSNSLTQILLSGSMFDWNYPTETNAHSLNHTEASIYFWIKDPIHRSKNSNDVPVNQ